MLSAMSADGYAPRSVAQCRVIAGMCFKAAERRGLLGRSPVPDSQRRGKPPALLDGLETDEVRQVLKYAVGDRLEALWNLALGLGIRQGELLRLTWRDVELEGDHPHVIVRTGKTESSPRVLKLAPYQVAKLREYHLRQRYERMKASLWLGGEYVFTNEEGTRLAARTLRTHWHRLTVDAGVGRRRFHASRHSAAVVMLDNGVPLDVVGDVLGHTDYRVTKGTYGALARKRMDEAVNTMERVLGGGA
jgi:integrase